MNHKAISIALVLALIAGVSAWAEVSGRDVADKGVRKELTGSLVKVGDEWELKAKDGTYALHLGPLGAKAGETLKDGAQASVTGFVDGMDVAPIRLSSGGKTLDFWGEDRVPSWSGQGRGRNRVDSDRGPAEAGRNRRDDGRGRGRR